MLKIVENATTYTPDMSRGTVTVESDCGLGKFHEAIEELGSNEAKHFALAAVAHMGLTHINGNIIGPYPVNAQGAVLDLESELPPTHPERQPSRYRIDVPVTRKF